MALDNFSSFFDLLTLGAYRASPEGRLQRANMALVRLHGFASEAELLKAANAPGVETHVLPARKAEFAAQMHSANKVMDFSAEIYRLKTGELVWVRQHAHAVTDYQGIVKYFEGTVEEIANPGSRAIPQEPPESSQDQPAANDKAVVLEAVVQTIPDLLWLKDARGIYQACNAAFARHFGHTADQIIGKSDAHFPGNQVALRLARTDQSTLFNGQTASFEEELPSPGAAGATGMFEIIKTPMRNALGDIIAELGMARDITERKRSENQLRDASEQFELALISAELGVWAQTLRPALGSGEAMRFEMDSRARAILGLRPQDLQNSTSWTQWVHPDDLPQALQEMHRHLAHQTLFFEAEFRAQHHDGRWLWLSSRGKVVQSSPSGEPLRVVGTLMDITARRGAEEAIRQMAFEDALTSLPNRRLLVDRLQQALLTSARNKRCGALLFLDLDKFKHLNDTLGHDVGDQLLQQVAQRILKNVRAVDTVARIGGDEFVVLIADLSESADDAKLHATMVGQKILTSLNEPYDLGPHRHTSTPSIGATLFTGAENSPADVLRQADMAMYEAKAKGRNRLRFFEASFNEEIG
jgi:diguanylate cyclase (GGDEF)-like protein/PAS domain S-box-containing protein